MRVEKNFFMVVRSRVWLKISISNNSCQYSFVFASVGSNIDSITTQHEPKCVENCSDIKVSYN